MEGEREIFHCYERRADEIGMSALNHGRVQYHVVCCYHRNDGGDNHVTPTLEAVPKAISKQTRET